jgi:hypothetical protein
MPRQSWRMICGLVLLATLAGGVHGQSGPTTWKSLGLRGQVRQLVGQEYDIRTSQEGYFGGQRKAKRDFDCAGQLLRRNEEGRKNWPASLGMTTALRALGEKRANRDPGSRYEPGAAGRQAE